MSNRLSMIYAGAMGAMGATVGMLLFNPPREALNISLIIFLIIAIISVIFMRKKHDLNCVEDVQ